MVSKGVAFGGVRGSAPAFLAVKRSALRAPGIIEQVIVSPLDTDADPPAIELIGELEAMLDMAGAFLDATQVGDRREGSVLAAFVSSVKAAQGAEPLPCLLPDNPLNSFTSRQPGHGRV